MHVPPIAIGRQIAIDAERRRQAQIAQASRIHRRGIGIDAHLGCPCVIGEEQTARGDHRLGLDAQRCAVAGAAMSADERIDQREVDRHRTQKVDRHLGGVEPMAVVVVLVLQRQDAQQGIEAQRIGVAFVRPVLREDDPEMRVRPDAREGRPVEHRPLGEWSGSEILAEIGDVVGTAARRDEAVAEQIGEHEHVAVVRPQRRAIACGSERHIGVAGVVQEIDEGLDESGVGSSRRTVRERPYLRLDHDPNVARGECRRARYLREAGPESCALQCFRQQRA